MKNITVLSTRPDDDANNTFMKLLKDKGFNVLHFPAIIIKPIDDYKSVDDKINNLNVYEGIFFTSSNSVRFFCERLKKLNVKFVGKIYSVGEKTAFTLKSYGYSPDIIPDKFSSEELLGSLPVAEVQNKWFLYPCGNISLKSIMSGLKGVSNVDELIVYNTTKPKPSHLCENIKEKLNNKLIDCICFFSPSAVDNFFELFSDCLNDEIVFATIGDTTANLLDRYGFKTNVKPEISTSESMVETLSEFFLISKTNY